METSWMHFFVIAVLLINYICMIGRGDDTILPHFILRVRGLLWLIYWYRYQGWRFWDILRYWFSRLFSSEAWDQLRFISPNPYVALKCLISESVQIYVKVLQGMWAICFQITYCSNLECCIWWGQRRIDIGDGLLRFNLRNNWRCWV